MSTGFGYQVFDTDVVVGHERENTASTARGSVVKQADK